MIHNSEIDLLVLIFGVGLDRMSKEQNARIIAVARPGTGLSDFKGCREILDWPDDAIELADALQVDRFTVLGISEGGPYAAACAFKIPERLTATAIVSGMGPVDAPGARDGTSWTYPGKGSVTRRLLLMMTSMGLRKKPDQFSSNTKETFEGPDKELVSETPELMNGLVDTIGEALRSGVAGAHYEAGLYTHPWGFRLEDISIPVQLWQGELDTTTPARMGHYLSHSLPNCQARFYPDEGHYSLPFSLAIIVPFAIFPLPASRLNRSLEVGYGWVLVVYVSVLYWRVDCSPLEGRSQCAIKVR